MISIPIPQNIRDKPNLSIAVEVELNFCEAHDFLWLGVTGNKVCPGREDVPHKFDKLQKKVILFYIKNPYAGLHKDENNQ